MDRCGVGCLANNADSSGIPYPAGVGLRPTKAHNSTSPLHVAGQSRGPGLVHEGMRQMTAVVGGQIRRWPLTDGVVAEAHQYPPDVANQVARQGGRS